GGRRGGRSGRELANPSRLRDRRASHGRLPSQARSKPSPGPEADEIPQASPPPPLAKPKAAAGSSTSERSATGLAQRFERSSHDFFLRAEHLALEHARSDRQQHAVAQKPQYGEADDAGEHQ